MSGPTSILLVDDDDEVRSAFATALEAAGYRVLGAASGETALELARQYVPDVVVVDAVLPDVDGIGICSRIKSSPSLADVAVLLYSAHFTPSADDGLGFDFAADGFMAKPADPVDLIARVEGLLRLRSAEAAGRAQERHARAMFDGSIDAMLIADDERVYVDANSAACELYGMDFAEIVGKRIDDFMAVSDRNDLDGVWARFLESGRFEGELRVHLPDGSYRDVDARARAHVLPGRHLSVLRDVTERRRADAARLRFDAVVEASYDAIITKALDETVLSWNPAAEHIFGYTAAEMIGKSALTIVPPDHAAEFADLNARVRRGESIPPFETRRLRRDGSEFDVSVTISPIGGEGGAIVGAAFVARDISDNVASRKALEHSETVLRTVIDVLPVGVWLTDPAGTIVLSNPAGRAIWGGERLVGREDYGEYKAWWADTGERVAADEWGASRALSSGTAVLGDVVEIEGFDGARKTILSSAVPARDAGGEIAGVVVVNEDITIRREMERALALRLREQAVVAEIGRLALTVGEVDDVFDLAVHRVAEILDVEFASVLELGTSGESFRVESSVGLQPGTSPHIAVAAASHSQAGHTIATMRSVIVEDIRDEKRFTFEAHASVEGVRSAASVVIPGISRPYGVLSAHSKRVGRFGGQEVLFLESVAKILAEALERRRGEQAVREREGQFRMILDQMPLGCLLHDAEARFTYWNPAAERIFGFDFDAVRGLLPFDTIVSPASRSFVEEVFRELERGGPAVTTVGENLTKDGRTIVCEWSSIPLVDAERTFIGVLSVAQDVTERRKLEEQLLQSQKMEGVGRLAGGVAHDFNNLLTVIGGYSDLALGRIAKEDPLRFDLAEIRAAADRAADLTHQLLAFSRKQILEPKVLDLNVVVVGAARMLQRLIGEDIELAVHTAPLLGLVLADPGQLEQVIVNLTVNARDAMPLGGKLTIRTDNVVVDEAFAGTHDGEVVGPHVTLAVTDTGCGMTAALQVSIFEPFFTTKEPGKGTGLGLSTVYGIVRQSGGYVDVSSVVGEGTTFTIYLPVLDAAVETPGEAVASREVPRGDETILLIEDEPEVRKLASLALRMSGYNVLESRDGEDAIAMAAGYTGPIHLILTDVVMPRMSGPVAADRLTSARPDARVLYTSGYNEDASVHLGILDAKIAFLAKPFGPDALARRVREVLDAPPPKG